MRHAGTNHSTHRFRLSQTALFFFLILLTWIFLAVPFEGTAMSAETWKLVKREYPVLPEAIQHIREGRNAGSFIKVSRTQRRNEALYINKNVVRGQTECLWVSGFIWNDNVPEVINTGRQYMIPLEARFDRRQGTGCGMARISVTFGNRAEPLRDRAPNVVHVRNGLADPDPGGIAPPASTEIFRVDARPDLPNNDLFTIAIHISTGSITNQVVALYVYQKVGTRGGTVTPTPPVQPRPGQQTFTNPTIDGYRLDICREWAANCGKPAADAFCRRMGYDSATSFQPDHDIGARTPTKVISSGQICNAAYCDGFRSITCSRAQTNRSRGRVFTNPTINGYRLDICREWAANCGKPAADAFCRQMGYRGASSYQPDNDIGARTPTRVISSGQICRDAYCDGFRSITCY